MHCEHVRTIDIKAFSKLSPVKVSVIDRGCKRWGVELVVVVNIELINGHSSCKKLSINPRQSLSWRSILSGNCLGMKYIGSVLAV